MGLHHLERHRTTLPHRRARERHQVLRDLGRRPPRNELWRPLEREWAAITVEDVRNLYRGMARRVAALKLVRGWHTKY